MSYDRRGTARVENHECKVYVGNLGDFGDKGELDRAFGKYGPLKSVWARPGFTIFLYFSKIQKKFIFFKKIQKKFIFFKKIQNLFFQKNSKFIFSKKFKNYFFSKKFKIYFFFKKIHKLFFF